MVSLYQKVATFSKFKT